MTLFSIMKEFDPYCLFYKPILIVFDIYKLLAKSVDANFTAFWKSRGMLRKELELKFPKNVT